MQPFVFDRAPHVGAHVADQPERKLEDVGAGRAANRHAPLSLMAKQPGFFLRAGNRDAEFVVVHGRLPGHGPHGDATEDAGDLGLVQGRRPDRVDVVRGSPVRQQLHRAHAVSADFPQQFEGVGRAQPEPVADAVADLRVVRQQVVEVIGHHVAAVVFAGRQQRQRQRQRTRSRRCQPGRQVGQA